MENISKDLVLLVLLLIETIIRVHIIISIKLDGDSMIDFKVIYNLYDSMSIHKNFSTCYDSMYIIKTRLFSNDNIVFMLFSNLLNINFNKNKGAKPQFGLGVFILGRQL